MTMNKIYSHTLSLCHVCKSKISARIIGKGEQVFMEKFCPEHGYAQTLISSDKIWYEQSLQYVKPGQLPLKYNNESFSGCPESCGFCKEHQQHTCLPVVEINSNCDLACPICLKGDNCITQMSITDFDGIVKNLIATEGKVDVLNISGGEPTLHPQLVDFFGIASKSGITQISVSTNGLQLLNDKELREQFKQYNVIVALQFDGFRDTTYSKLRGSDLAEHKLKLIEILEQEEILFSLVATIANNINIQEVTDITEFFFKSKALTLMFQPVAFTGSAEALDPIKNRVTISDVVKEIEKCKFVKQGDFNPLPCSHFSCFALAYFLSVDSDNYFSLKEFLGVDNYLVLIANKTLPGLDSSGYSMMKQRLYEFWSAADANDLNEKVMLRIKSILKEMASDGFDQKQALNLGKNNMKGIFIHHFMDVYNFDFSRLVKCCNPYPQVGNRLVPICAQNIILQ